MRYLEYDATVTRPSKAEQGAKRDAAMGTISPNLQHYYSGYYYIDGMELLDSEVDIIPKSQLNCMLKMTKMFQAAGKDLNGETRTYTMTRLHADDLKKTRCWAERFSDTLLTHEEDELLFSKEQMRRFKSKKKLGARGGEDKSMKRPNYL